MKKLLKILAAPAFIFLFFSCEKTIEFKKGEIASLIVVNGELHPGDSLRVQIKKSRSTLENNFFYESLPDATVKLFKDGAFVEELRYVARMDTFMEYLNYDVNVEHEYPNGYYVSGNVLVQSGSTYFLEITREGYERVTCETTVPFPVSINSFSLVCENAMDEYSNGYINIKTKLNFSDPGAEKNYYNIKAGGVMGYDKNIPGYSYFHGYHYGTNEDNISPSDTILITALFFPYFHSSDPVFNVESEGIHDYSFFATQFTDELINGKAYTLSLIFDYFRKIHTEYGEFYTLTLHLENLSPEFYLYSVSKAQQDWVRDNPFAEPVPVYSNVEGGLGIFGSSAARSISGTIGEYPMAGKTYIPEEAFYKDYAY
jgi:hypothetical protein